MLLVSVRGGVPGRNIGSFKARIKFRDFVPILFILSLLPPECAESAFERACQPPSLVGRGMAGVFLPKALAPDLNPSCLGPHDGCRVDCAWAASPFSLRELSGIRASLVIPIGNMGLGWGISTTGFPLYRETSFRCTLSAGITPGFTAGLNAWIDHLSIARYGDDVIFGLDAAVTVDLGRGLTCGASMLNLNRPAVGEVQDPLPQIFIAGGGWKVSEAVALALDIVKDVRNPGSLRVGVEVAPLQGLKLRCGTFDRPARFSGGGGVEIGSFVFEYAVTTHAVLGLSHTLGASFEW